MAGNDRRIPQRHLRGRGVVGAELFPNRPDGRRGRNESETFKGYTGVAVQPVIICIEDSKLHFVCAGLAIGFEQDRQNDRRPIG